MSKNTARLRILSVLRRNPDKWFTIHDIPIEYEESNDGVHIDTSECSISALLREIAREPNPEVKGRYVKGTNRKEWRYKTYGIKRTTIEKGIVIELCADCDVQLISMELENVRTLYYCPKCGKEFKKFGA